MRFISRARRRAEPESSERGFKGRGILLRFLLFLIGPLILELLLVGIKPVRCCSYACNLLI